MIDYKVAFREGLTASEDVKIALKEIDSIFEKLNSEIFEASGGRIILERRRFPDPGKSLQEMMTLKGIARALISHLAIVASNPTIPESPVKELAKWSTDRRGYPCKISWEGQEHYCEDKEALERVLAELLRDPAVGRKLNALMHPAAQQDTEPNSDSEN